MFSSWVKKLECIRAHIKLVRECTKNLVKIELSTHQLLKLVSQVSVLEQVFTDFDQLLNS